VPLQPLRRSINSAIAKDFPSQSPAPSQVSVHRDLQALVSAAEKLRADAGDSYVGAHHLLQALMQDGKAGKLLKEQGLTVAKVRALVAAIRKGRKVESQAEGEGNYEYLKKYGRDLVAEAEKGAWDVLMMVIRMCVWWLIRKGGEGARAWPAKGRNESGTTKGITADFSKLNTTGKLDPVIGRDREIRRVIEVLSRRTKNNPVLLGEPGVGKTAIAEGLALRILNGDVPKALEGCRLVSLDMGALVAGAKYHGVWSVFGWFGG
jgi:ATP-dependent Clp protease ATP-binding subunit ClpB